MKRTFVKIKTRRRAERARYEVRTDDGYVGEVYSIGNGRTWCAELEGELIKTAATRYEAGAALGFLGRDKPKWPRFPDGRRNPWRPVVIRQPVIVVGERRDHGARTDTKGERAAAARKVLLDHAAVLDAAGITAKVASDGFVYMSPAAIERLLALVEAA